MAVEPPPLSPGEELDLVLSAFGVARMIVGHTPSLSGVTMSHDGGIIQIDTGASAYYGGARSFLEIEGDVVRANENGEYRILLSADETAEAQP